MMRKHIQIRLHGDLSNKGIKLRALREALRLNIFGWISEADHLVKIEAEGEESDLDAFVLKCREGFSRAIPDYFSLENKPLHHYDRFMIL